MNFLKGFIFFILSIFVSTYVLADDDKEEAPVEVRLLGAKKVLLEQANIALVYVKGLVCPSCAIGVRKNLSKMVTERSISLDNRHVFRRESRPI